MVLAATTMIPISFDPVLATLSIAIAICGSYTSFRLAARLRELQGSAWKADLALAAVAIGGSIWAMHFVAMLALRIPVLVSYDLVDTLISVMVAIGITGIALYAVTCRTVSPAAIIVGGFLMGLGIAGMHYMGMTAMRAAACAIAYDPWLVAASVLVGIAASTFALWMAFRVRSRLKQLSAAIAMGSGIASMHYTGMAATSFIAIDQIQAIGFSGMNRGTLGAIISVIAFVLFGTTFLLAAPAPKVSSRPDGAVPELMAARIPVVSDKKTILVNVADVVCIKADSHYTAVWTSSNEFFCNLSISDVERRLFDENFCKVHRSYIVNLRRVKSFHRVKDNGELNVEVSGEERVIPVSRGKIAHLQSVLGL